MTRLTHDWPETEPKFFTGIEIENTKAKGLKTLFVIGVQDPSEIVNTALSHKAMHVYLGANHSYSHLMTGWYNMTKACIDNNLAVSINFYESDINYLKQEMKELWIHELFIPQLSIPIPNINTENKNFNIKIDDMSINRQTNKGIWCFDLKDVLTTDNLTTWDQFANDKPLNN